LAIKLNQFQNGRQREHTVSIRTIMERALARTEDQTPFLRGVLLLDKEWRQICTKLDYIDAALAAAERYEASLNDSSQTAEDMMFEALRERLPSDVVDMMESVTPFRKDGSTPAVEAVEKLGKFVDNAKL